MKYILILFLCMAAAAQDGPSSYDKIPDTHSFASVREYPTYLHKCMATFVTHEFLLTTAACVLCADECKLQVRAFSNHLSGNFDPLAKSYNVTEIFYHPDYPVYPETHNVAVIRVNGWVNEAVIYKVANFTSDIFGFKGSVFSWQFSKDMTDYLLQKKRGETVSNTACSFSLNKYVSHFFICVMANDFISLGPFDQGSPFIISYKETTKLAGVYDDTVAINKMKFVAYQSLQPFYEWINYVTRNTLNPDDGSDDPDDTPE